MLKHHRNQVPSNSARLTLVSLAMVAGLAGCHKQPGGQVVAVVNDEEVTQQELTTEAQAAQLTGGGKDKPAAADLLQRVIDRNLLADYARAEGLDRGPEFVARRRQLEQSLLADVAARKLAGAPGAPTQAEIKNYIASHPLAFAERQNLALDQVRFATLGDAAVLKQITDMPTIDGVIAQLNAKGIKFSRGASALDTATIGAAAAKQIVELKPGEAFALSTGGQTYVSVITDRQPVVADPATWPDLASNALRSEKMTTAMTDAVKRLRAAATITYDPSFKPAK
ncbi:hypothetical protein EON83_24645 [bacterium]|nr:MAG: hypothetical protein EON83_24645 [bacterium]